MIRKINIIYFLFLGFLAHSSIGQESRQDYVWLFGQDDSYAPGTTGYLIDFNSDDGTFVSNDNGIGMSSANSSVCDKDGNLLFYSNGCFVMNADFEMMPNGDSINYDVFIDALGINCNRGYIGFQDNLILKDPVPNDEYYFIHKPRIYNGLNTRDSFPIWYSKVDMTLDGGKGDIYKKNETLYDESNTLASYLTAIHHENSKDWWMIQPLRDDSVFAVFVIDESGVSLHSKQQAQWFFTGEKSSSGGTAKFSPDGSMYALYNITDGLLLYDFDRRTGNLNFKEQIIPFDTMDFTVFCSMEWSPDSRFIYTASTTKLHQVDTWETDVQSNGIRLIDTYNGTQDPFSTIFFLLALAPNCKIYMCPTSSTNSYHVINKPNELGKACNFNQNGLVLPETSSLGSMPNFPRYRVDEEIKCDPTITSTNDQSYTIGELHVYPIPSRGRIHVELPESIRSGSLNVVNLQGQEMYKAAIEKDANDPVLDLEHCPSGIYLVYLLSDEGIVFRQLISVVE